MTKLKPRSLVSHTKSGDWAYPEAISGKVKGQGGIRLSETHEYRTPSTHLCTHPALNLNSYGHTQELTTS